MPYFEMWHRVGLVRTDVSEKRRFLQDVFLSFCLLFIFLYVRTKIDGKNKNIMEGKRALDL
jgi:hypothetical protein